MGRDIREDFEEWTAQWEKAQKDGIFNDTAKPTAPPPQQRDYYSDDSDQNTVKEVDAEYWKRVYRLSANMADVPDPLQDPVDNSELTGDEPVAVNEDSTDWSKSNDKMSCPCKVTKPDGKSVSKITDELGKLANPVHTSTRGPDNKLRVTPNWAFGPDLASLNNLKIKLQQLEDKMAVDPMLEDKKTKNIIAQIDTLKDKIDELSDLISPEFRTEYLS